MNTLFGVPETTLALGISTLMSVVLLILAWQAIRNPVICKMGLRNTVRRRSQAVLIVFGLMLSTVLLTTSIIMGDSVSASVRTSQLPQVGNLDEGISKQTSVVKTAIPYFSAREAQQITATLQANPTIAHIVGGIMTPQQSIPVFDLSTQQVSAENAVLAVPPDFGNVWGTLQTTAGHTLDFHNLKPGQVYIGTTLAAKLNAHVGDSIHVFINNHPVLFSVAAILAVDINPVGGTSQMLVLPLAQYQSLMGIPGSVNTLYIRNQGPGGLSDLGPDNRTANAIMHYVNMHLPGYQISAYKINAINNAASQGSTITLAVSAVGTFLLLAGVLLIYLIFMMLAHERKAELGMSRAVGMQRDQLIQMFVFEGLMYTLASTLIGIPLGIGIAEILIQLINRTPLPPAVNPVPLALDVPWQALLLAFSIGVLFTIIIVAFSAYRISRTNIIAAISDTDGQTQRANSPGELLHAALKPLSAGERELAPKYALHLPGFFLRAFLKVALLLIWTLCVSGPLFVLIGLLLVSVGIWAKELFLYEGGISFLLLSSGLMIRALMLMRPRVSQARASRLGFSVASLGLLLYWLQPFGPWEKLIGVYDRLNLGSFQASAEIFFLTTLITGASAVWLIMYNGDLLIQALLALVRPLARTSAVARPSMAYPLNNKFRTAMIVAMFTMVIFLSTLVVTLDSSINQNAQVDRYTGGWELQTDSANLPPDFIQQIKNNPKLSKEIDVNHISWLDDRFYKMQQVVPGKKPPTIQGLLRAVNDSFLNDTTITLQARAKGYTTDHQVWEAVKNQNNLAVLWNIPTIVTGIAPDFQPFTVQVQDPHGAGSWHQVTVIGILPTLTQWPGLYVSTRTGAQIYPTPIVPRWYNFRIMPGYTDNQVRLDMGAVFGAKYGIEVETLSQKLGWTVGTFATISVFLTGYLMLGLIIGICGLGVISSRAVVERRQQIGMLRALGYSRGLVQCSFLLESSFVAILGLCIGAALGIWSAGQAATAIIPSRNVFQDAASLPFLELGLILLGSLCASLLATYVPARAAARVRPAEALRYE